MLHTVIICELPLIDHPLVEAQAAVGSSAVALGAIVPSGSARYSAHTPLAELADALGLEPSVPET